jgi:hypothetical protein
MATGACAAGVHGWPANVVSRCAGRWLGCCGVGEGELLTGDGISQGIVRSGDTLRRPLRPISVTVRAYLAHLPDAGFTGAPVPDQPLRLISDGR